MASELLAIQRMSINTMGVLTVVSAASALLVHQKVFYNRNDGSGGSILTSRQSRGSRVTVIHKRESLLGFTPR